MPAILIPVLWVGGAVILLGGGWYVIATWSTNAVVPSTIEGRSGSAAKVVGLLRLWAKEVGLPTRGRMTALPIRLPVRLGTGDGTGSNN